MGRSPVVTLELPNQPRVDQLLKEFHRIFLTQITFFVINYFLCRDVAHVSISTPSRKTPKGEFDQGQSLTTGTAGFSKSGGEDLV